MGTPGIVTTGMSGQFGGGTILQRHDPTLPSSLEYFDAALFFAERLLIRHRGEVGLFRSPDRRRMLLFWAGAVHMKGTVRSGRGRPLAKYLANAGRLMLGAIHGAIRKMGLDFGGLGYFDLTNPASIGREARWDAHMWWQESIPAVTVSFGEVSNIPEHLFKIKATRPVRIQDDGDYLRS